MPNWCENSVQIKGQDLSKLREQIGDGTNFISRFLPTPKALTEVTSPFNGTAEESAKLVAEYGSNNWYDWNVKNWGTKWDFDAEIGKADDGSIYLHFDSAWGPPLEAMVKISQLFPEVTIRHAYFESGMCFVGVAQIFNGEIDDNYNEDPDSEEWQTMAMDEFGWAPEIDDEDEDQSSV